MDCRWSVAVGSGDRFDSPPSALRGDRKYRRDRWRSIPPEHFRPLADIAGVRLFRLQKYAAGEHGPDPADGFPLTNLDQRLDEEAGPFMDTAAVMRNLDLVITSDTAIAHLAGALAVPVWVALPAAPDWRWLLARHDSPWYPSMRLFRQSTLGHWDDVFLELAQALRQHVTR